MSSKLTTGGSEVKLLSRVQLFGTPWTVACQGPLSMEFSRQEYWSGYLFPSPGDLSNPGIEPRSPTLQADSLPSELPGRQQRYWFLKKSCLQRFHLVFQCFSLKWQSTAKTIRQLERVPMGKMETKKQKAWWKRKQWNDKKNSTTKTKTTRYSNRSYCLCSTKIEYYKKEQPENK